MGTLTLTLSPEGRGDTLARTVFNVFLSPPGERIKVRVETIDRTILLRI
jgi:hypothetical protein